MTRPSAERVEDVRGRFLRGDPLSDADVRDLIAEIDALRAEHVAVAEATREAFVEAAEQRALEDANAGRDSFPRNQEAAYMKIADLAPIVERVTGRRA